MDLVNFDQQVYHQIVADFTKIAEKLELKNVQYIPISALGGDNVVSLSEQMPWYQGPALLPYLENVELHKADDTGDARFQIQYVIRPQTEELHDYRGYAGQVSGAGFRKGDKIIVLPNELNSAISKIEHHGKEVEQIHAGEPAVIHLEDDLDISRGDLIVKADELPYVTKMHEAIICWMDEKPMTIGNKYMLQQHSRMVKAAIKGIPFRINVNSLEQETGIDKLELNQVANISLQTASPLAYDIYEKSKATGSAILIDETSHKTVAAILFQQPLN